MGGGEEMETLQEETQQRVGLDKTILLPTRYIPLVLLRESLREDLCHTKVMMSAAFLDEGANIALRWTTVQCQCWPRAAVSKCAAYLLDPS